MKTLKGKLITGITIVSLTILIITSLTIWKVFKSNLKNYIISDMDRIKSIALNEIEATYQGDSLKADVDLKDKLLLPFNTINKKYNCYISLDEDENTNISFTGQIILESYKREILKNSKQKASLLYLVLNKQGYFATYSYPIHISDIYRGTLILQKNYGAEYSNYKKIMLQIITIEGILYIIMLTILLFWFTNVTRALKDLTLGMKQIEAGNYILPLEIKGNDEISLLTKHFNLMQNKINKQMEQLYIEKKKEEELDAETKNFFNYATHEMKTPITAIKGYGELLEQGNVEENLRNKMYSRIVLEANRIDNLVRNMLVIARGKGRIEQKSEVLNLKELIEEMAIESEMLLEKEKVKISLCLADIKINAAKEELRIAFKNLIENAIKYSLDKMIYIYNLENNPYTIVIKNSCLPIPDKIREHLFEPFVKYNYGNIEKVSSGLGLFICKELLEKNNAKICYKTDEENISFIVEIQEQFL